MAKVRGEEAMPVTLEPISAFGLAPTFWNLPAVTANDEPIEYFTFSSRWDLRLLTNWQLIALQGPATAQIIRLMHIEEDDLPDSPDADGALATATPSFPEDIGNFLSLSPAELDALIVWLQLSVPRSRDEADAGRILEVVDVEALMYLGLPHRIFDFMSIGGQPDCYYLYHTPQQDALTPPLSQSSGSPAGRPSSILEAPANPSDSTRTRASDSRASARCKPRTRVAPGR